MASLLTNPQAILDAVNKATKELGFCPNRVWSVAKSLPGGPDQFPKLLPPTENLSCGNLQIEDHRLCTFDFCEQSRINFTLMTQRHENNCFEGRCHTIQFPSELVETAVRKEQPTAWNLQTMAPLEGKEHYMAISHVWSDGTGAGNRPVGHVNDCLLEFFWKFATEFNCVGIWWDTICIPMKKDLREKALKDMQRNYSAAAVTLVHDCFLRGCEWRDAESAAFYIVMSPWFSRGWTALELKESTRVKVIFKDQSSGGLITKDLDEDILQVGSNPSASHQYNVAKEIIARLRGKRINHLSNLVAVLGSRYTSWPRDMAIISGLMVGIQMPATYSQQKIYQEILQEIGEVSHAHLFHNSATMTHGYNWCPTNLYDLPVTSHRDVETLRIEKNGNLFGKWDIMSLDLTKDDRFTSGHAHPLVGAKVQLARLKKDQHILLVEPEFRADGADISRALLVEPSISKNGDSIDCYCDYVGPIYFNPPLNISKTGDASQVFSFNNIHLGYDVENHNDSDRSTRKENTAQGAIEKMKIGSVNTQARKRETSSRDSDLQKDRKSKDWNEFMKSVIDGDYEKAEALLDVVDNLSRADRDGWSVLHHAIWNGRTRIAKRLIAKLDIQVLEKSNLGEEPLHLAAERGNQEVVALLLEHSTVRMSRKDGLNALHLAARQGFSGVVEKLLDKGWEINATEPEKKQTALHMASFRGHQSVVSILIRSNNQLDLKDKRGLTAFCLAVRGGHEKIALLLKEAGADVNLRLDKEGHTLLHLEATDLLSPPENIRMLCRIGVDLDARNKLSKTALHEAALLGQVPAINALLDGKRKANIEARDAHQMTPLHQAAQAGQADSAKRLVELGADLEAQETMSLTPLHEAAQNGRIEIIELLLNGNRRANIEARDEEGQTPLQLTVKRGRVDALKGLIRLGADIGVLNKYEDTLLHIAAENGRADVIELLLDGDHKADIEARNYQDKTPLHIAAFGGQIDAIKSLVARGANLQARDGIFDETPYKLALEFKQFSASDILRDLEREC